MSDGRTIDATTQVCAVWGNPVEHSLSPAIHNAAFAECQLNYVYVGFRVEDVAAATAGFRALHNFRGLSVTIPHKVAIMPHLDRIDDIARHIGSVNTVVKEESGTLRGTSTDGPAAVKALRDRGADPADRHVLILGSGGAARAVAFALAMLPDPPRLTILGVVGEEVRRLAVDLRDRTAAAVQGAILTGESLAAAIATAEILVHCTPVGMAPHVDATLVPCELLRSGLAVFDIVYTPRRTRLLREAAAADCLTIEGLDMFVNQAAAQFELWTGCPAPVPVMRRVVKERLR